MKTRCAAAGLAVLIALLVGGGSRVRADGEAGAWDSGGSMGAALVGAASTMLAAIIGIWRSPVRSLPSMAASSSLAAANAPRPTRGWNATIRY